MSIFRFAVMGAGGISNKFCDAVRRLNGCEVVAVASKSLQRAQEFAQRNQIAQSYDSYEEMLDAEKPDCVYIGVHTSAHYELTMLCLDKRVPVLCEKSMTVNRQQAEEIFRRARELNVFVMEAMWSRFLPALKKAKEWIGQGRIGKPVYCEASIGFIAPQGEENRFHNPALGGGAAYDLLVYAYELTTYMIPDPIEEIQSAVLWEKTGVDGTEHITLRFPEALASLTATFQTPIEERLVICGTEGRIAVPCIHFASEALLYDREKKLVETFHDEQTENGFVYEVQETMDCIRARKYESSIVPQSCTLDCAGLFDLLEEKRISL